MAGRERRQVRPPVKFGVDEDYDQGTRRTGRPQRQVYRLMKRKDIRNDLVGKEVFVHWPEDQQWYRGLVEEVCTQDYTAYLHYPDTDEYEDIDLDELIEAKQIAFMETRSIYTKLKHDEIPVNAADGPIVIYEDRRDSDVSTEPSSDEADEEDHVIEVDDMEKPSRENHKQVQRSKRPREGSDKPDRQGSAKKQASHAAVTHGDAGTSNGGHGHGPTQDGPDADEAEAEAFKNNLISALMHNFTGAGPAGPLAMGMIPTPGAGPMLPGGGGAGGGPMIMIPTPGGAGQAAGGPPSARGDKPGGLRSTGSAQLASVSSVGGGDEEVRAKVREQLVAALQKATDELQAEGYTEALPAPAAVAAEVELELYKAHGNSVSKDYKARFRSLSFNLKDPANPELRARVLRGELAPGVLVTLGPVELARKELSEWRKKREEEAVKAVFLDAETAAKYSTAAAAALAAKRLSGREEAEAAAKPEGPERPPSPSPGADGEGEGDGDGGEHRGDGEGGLGLHRIESITTTNSGGATPVAAAADDGLVRRTSVTSGLPTMAATPAAAAAGDAAAGVGGTGGKRAVLRAALPSVAATGDETPPREYDPEQDAPYDPEALDETPYDPEQEDLPEYDPVGKYDPAAEEYDPAAAGGEGGTGETHGSVERGPSSGGGSAPAAAHDGGAPTLASLRSARTTPTITPTASASAPHAAAPVADLVPVILRQPQPGEPGGEVTPDNVGETLWTGLLRNPSGQQPPSVVEVAYLGGGGRLGPMLRTAQPPNELMVKGQLKASRVEQFFEELRRSRSRTISLALVRQLSPAAAAAIGAISEEQAAAIEAAEAAGGGGGLAEFIAQHRNRIGLSTPQPALEAYLVTRSPLALRLLKTARGVCPAHQLHMLPDDIPDDQLLLAMVHPKAWEPPHHLMPPAARPAAADPRVASAPPPHSLRAATAAPPAAGALDLGGGSGILPPLINSGSLQSPMGGFGADSGQGGAVGDPRMGARGAAAADPRVGGGAPTATGAADAAPGGLPIDLGALNDLAAALGLPGGGGGPAAAAPPPAADASGSAAGGQQLVTLVMQNPDGTLAIVAVPQGTAGAPGQEVLQQQQPGGPGAPGPGAAPGMPPPPLYGMPPPPGPGMGPPQPPLGPSPVMLPPGQGPPPFNEPPPGPYGGPPPQHHPHHPPEPHQHPPGASGGFPPPGPGPQPPYGHPHPDGPPPYGGPLPPHPYAPPHEPYDGQPPPPHHRGYPPPHPGGPPPPHHYPPQEHYDQGPPPGPDGGPPPYDWAPPPYEGYDPHYGGGPYDGGHDPGYDSYRGHGRRGRGPPRGGGRGAPPDGWGEREGGGYGGRGGGGRGGRGPPPPREGGRGYGEWQGGRGFGGERGRGRSRGREWGGPEREHRGREWDRERGGYGGPRDRDRN